MAEEQAPAETKKKLSSSMLLATAIAHEINNPLQGALACVKALRDGVVAEDKRDEYFAAVSEGLGRIRATVQGLLKQAQRTEALCDELGSMLTVNHGLLLLLAVVEAHDGAFTLQRDHANRLSLVLKLNDEKPAPEAKAEVEPEEKPEAEKDSHA